MFYHSCALIKPVCTDLKKIDDVSLVAEEQGAQT